MNLERNNRTQDFTDRKFGSWSVIKYTGYHHRPHRKWHKKEATYLCACKCGHKQTLLMQQVAGRQWAECDKCRIRTRLEKTIQPGERGFDCLYRMYVFQARFNGRDFFLTREEFKKITSSDCYYCGIEPSQEMFSRHREMTEETRVHGIYKYNGIDRKDTSGGYTIENSLPCCSKCNYMKRDMSVREFMSHIKTILKNSRIK